MKSFADLYRYEDGALNLPGWREFAGPAWVEDNTVGLSTGVDQLVYLVDEQMDSLEHLARCSFHISEARDTARVGLMVRAEIMAGVSPDVIHRCYLVTIDGTGLIEIFSILISDPVPVARASAQVTLDVDQGHTLIVKVRDHQQSQGDPGRAELLVYLDDEVAPQLLYSDSATKRPEGLYVGFDVRDSAGAMAADVGEFHAHVLRSSVIRNPQPVPQLRNLGDLVYEVGWRVDRGGNSQFDSTQTANFINYAMAEIYRFTHPWSWCERIYNWYTKPGLCNYEMPLWVKHPGSLTDRTSARILTKNGWQDLLILDPGWDASQTAAWRYAVMGTGDFGGVVVSLQPTPDDEYAIIMPCYAKPVPMTELTDIPMLPPEYLEVLIYGAVARAAEFTDARTLWQAAVAQFQKGLDQMRREDIARREENHVTRLRTVNELKRKEGTIAAYPRGVWPVGF